MEFDISHNNLSAAKIIKISETLKNTTCLHIFRMSNISIDSEEAVESITTAIASNCFIIFPAISCPLMDCLKL